MESLELDKPIEIAPNLKRIKVLLMKLQQKGKK